MTDGARALRYVTTLIEEYERNLRWARRAGHDRSVAWALLTEGL